MKHGFRIAYDCMFNGLEHFVAIVFYVLPSLHNKSPKFEISVRNAVRKAASLDKIAPLSLPYRSLAQARGILR